MASGGAPATPPDSRCWPETTEEGGDVVSISRGKKREEEQERRPSRVTDTMEPAAKRMALANMILSFFFILCRIQIYDKDTSKFIASVVMIQGK